MSMLAIMMMLWGVDRPASVPAKPGAIVSNTLSLTIGD